MVWMNVGRDRRSEVSAGVQAEGREQSRTLCFKRMQYDNLYFLSSAKL